MTELLFLGAILAAGALSLILTPLVRAMALAIGFIDKPGERKIHACEIAYGGGIVLAAVVSLIFGAVLLLKHYNIVPLPSALDDLRGEILLAVAVGACCILTLGLIDDKYRLSPWTKLIVEFFIAAGVVSCGVRITVFIGDNLLTQIATACWIVLITNSFNLLDNMDGLCAGIIAITAAILGLVALDSQQWNLMLTLGALAGAAAGFLKYNRSPASIFLGDAGALFAGFLMACCAALVTYYHANKASHLSIGAPLLIFAIPLYDTFSVIYIRLKEKRPLMRGDTSHFSHRLVDLGMSRRQAVTTIHLACLAIGLPTVVLSQLSEERGLLLVSQAVLMMAIIASLEHASRQRVKRESRNGD